ncbi:MAG TPA: 6-pyruvoyl-tetrahydropterin synthase-related protein, partial [Anaerolineae bacterium]
MHSQQIEASRPGIHHFLRQQAFISLILLGLLALPALQPLFSRRLTCGFDTTFHLWRGVEAGTLLREGILFARWAPHMAHGYGYPLFLFQSPLSASLAALLNLLGASWPVAVNAVYALGLLLSMLTLWLLARDLWGERGGIAAAVAFLYAPFHAYVAFYRASLSETVAWSLPPLILWGLWRWQQRREPWGFAAAVLGMAVLMLVHDVSAYVFLPLFLGWIGTIALTERSWRIAGRGLLALALGLGSSAFFWLPALVERGSIQFERANSAWPFQYNHNFLPLDQLLALPRNADPTLLNDWPPRALGLLLLAVALLGCLAGLRQDREWRWLTALLAAALAGYAFFTLPLSRPLWDALPFLSAFQFPWRFLAPATLAAALLAGALFSRRLESNHTLSLAGWLASIFILSAGHWGWFYPDTCTPPADTSIAGMIAWEQASDTLGTTARRELLPITVQSMPQDEGELPPWQARLDPATLPAGTQILHSSYRPLGATIELNSVSPFQARYRAFAFSGWRVTIDGELAAIAPSVPDGLITFDVPAGRHTIIVRFGETPLRLAADVLSLISLLLAGVIAISVGHGACPEAAEGSPVVGRRSSVAGRPAIAVFLVALGLIGGKLLLVDQELTPLRESRLAPDGELAGLAQPLSLTFGGANSTSVLARLLGHQALPNVLPADEPLEIILYWRPLSLMTDDYRVGLTLVDSAGRRWSASDLRDSRWFRNPPPTTGWPPDHYVLTAFLVDALPGTPPGEYTLQLSLFERNTLAPLTTYDEAGRSLGPWVTLATVRLAEPRHPWQ